MGLEIDRDEFEEAEYTAFAERLRESLDALRALLARPGFGRGERSLGAELEVSLVDGAGRPLPCNTHVLAETRDPRLTVELERFNLECNLRPVSLCGRPFAALAGQLDEALAEMRRAAATCGGRVAAIGILPTLVAADLQSDSMTDSMRFRALSAGLRRLRLEPFRVRIRGESEALEVTCDDVTFEGANTSLQVHLRVDPERFDDVFNAVQMATAPVLAVAGNSPTFLGRELWEETRVALFKQSVDDRGPLRRREGREARVSFGRDWLEGGVLALFAEGVSLHEPLLPVLDREEPRRVLAEGGTPALRELRLHQGTVWRWNRPIYDPAAGGHVRVEMRALPSGPSVPDMVANAAFQVGLAEGLAPDAASWVSGFPFAEAHRNFYRAAQAGLRAELRWPPEPGALPEAVDAAALVRRLLPLAREGLERAGVAADEAEAWLAPIDARARTGRTGAAWQRRCLRVLERRAPRADALAGMLERYLALCDARLPVHEWPDPEAM